MASDAIGGCGRVGGQACLPRGIHLRLPPASPPVQSRENEAFHRSTRRQTVTSGRHYIVLSKLAFLLLISAVHFIQVVLLSIKCGFSQYLCKFNRFIEGFVSLRTNLHSAKVKDSDFSEMAGVNVSFLSLVTSVKVIRFRVVKVNFSRTFV